jgi:hypothetical protein
MRSRAVLWCTAVLIVAGGSGCTGDVKDPKEPLGTPTLDGSVWNSDAAFVDVMKDSDGDGVSDFLERANGDVDTDGDGVADYLDSDDDGDGVPTATEKNLDTDVDGAPDYLDTDDDGDGTLTKDEIAAAGGASVDTDGDGVPDYRDDDRLVDAQDAGVEKECAQSTAKADLRKRPVDIVFVIDNSSSMDGEILAVQNSINADFAKLIGMSGIDYRVIMLGDFGFYDYASPLPMGTTDACSVCISGELNPGQTCPATEADAVYSVAPKTSARFFHYDPDGNKHAKDTSVGSKNSLCRALQWFKKPDGFGLAPNGWSQWLRKDAAKVFVEITDDQADCSVDLNGDGTADFRVKDTEADPMNPSDATGMYQAKLFDTALRMLSSEQFTAAEGGRNYVFHSIISMPFKPGMMDVPYEPNEAAAATANCSTGANPGRAYDGLSRLTGGLRYPVCAADQGVGMSDTSGFTAIFKRIAQGVVEGTKVACDFAIPKAPDGKTLDRNTVEVVYSQPSQPSADPISFRQVQDVESCAGQSGSFYFRNDTIALCSDTCKRVQADDNAKVDVRFGCSLPPRKEPPPLPLPPVPE